MFNISARLKEIDSGYYIVFNNLKKVFEVHNSKQGLDTYCLTSPYDRLDSRLIEYVLKTSSRFCSQIFDQIDKNNQDLIDSAVNDQQDKVRSNLKDIYSVVSNSSKSYDLINSMKTKWM